jgi:hypothetical protein
MTRPTSARQPQPAASLVARAALVGAVEAVEDALELVGFDPRPIVADREARAGAVGRDRDRDPAVGTGVADGVGDQIAKHLRETVGIGLDAAAHLTADGVVARSEQRQVPPQVLGELRQRHLPRLDQGAALSLGQRQQIVHEPVHPRDLAQQGRRLRGQLVALLTTPHQRLDAPAQDCEGAAQLVRGVGDEFALTAEARLEPVEHAVEGVGQDPNLVGAGVVDPVREVP